MTEALPSVAELAEALTAGLISHDPLLATDWGVPSEDLPELTPAWLQARRDLFAETAAALRKRRPPEGERVAAVMLAERAEVEVDWFDSGEAHAELQAALDSPLFRIRYCFEEMPTESEQDWELVMRRLQQVPGALEGWRESLEVSRQSGPRAARRQVEATADSLDDWAGDSVPTGAFGRLVGRRDASHDSLTRELHAAAARATSAFGEMAAYLRATYLPTASEGDAVGSERFGLWSRRYSGAVVAEDDYEWAADALRDVSRDQAGLKQEVAGAGSAVLVDAGASRLRWAEEQVAHAIDVGQQSGVLSLRGLPAIDVRPSPDGSSTYYSPASEDGTRAATVWFPPGESPSEIEYSMTVLFHESVPGHHVEASVQRRNANLNRFQRLVNIPAHSEGWALYAERLAEEIGLLDTPRARLGCRGSQALRLASLLIDVGSHCGLAPPASVRDLVGDDWNVAGAERLAASPGIDAATASWWVTNMLGRPGHRASYAAGERAWLGARAASSAAGEPPTEFHARVLGLGPLGLHQLRSEAAR